jgi:hypothetical protein
MHRINFFSKKGNDKNRTVPFSFGKEEIWQKMKLEKYRG